MSTAELVTRDPQLLKGVLPLLVLTLLAEEESYGYELVGRLQAGGLAGIATGTVYPVLSRLEREGWLGSRLVASDAGPARKYYRPTPAGLRHRDASQAAWESLAEVVSRALPRSIPRTKEIS
ncbi:PadR family transcriptional regulator [uncultured Friedmanniella sp.]|uniref:PadR family transcriptional regulator n=1 Tax=uncultured Friedmanniella sp. TaxID=335381 RepID=UPI0035CC23D3